LHALLDGIDQTGIELFTEYLQSQRLSSFRALYCGEEININYYLCLQKPSNKNWPPTTIYGTWMTMAHPSIAELLAMAGYDWVVIDTEHSAVDVSQYFK